MTLEQRIHLDLSMPSLRDAPIDSGALLQGRTQGEPDSAAQQAFEQAMFGSSPGAQPEADPDPAAHAQPGTEATDDVAPGGTGLSPLAGGWIPRLREAVAAADPAAAVARAEQFDRLGEVLRRMMVGEGGHGGGAVRLELHEDVLPGVVVLVERQEGRLQVDFVCSVEASRLYLNARLAALADDLARRVGDDVLLRVRTDDDEDPCLVEAVGWA